jgi:hypothetical protein
MLKFHNTWTMHLLILCTFLFLDFAFLHLWMALLIFKMDDLWFYPSLPTNFLLFSFVNSMIEKKTNVVSIYHLLKYTCWVWVMYVIFLPYFLKINLYFNQMHTQGYISLEKNTYFITLDIFRKYLDPKPYMFSNLGKSY